MTVKQVKSEFGNFLLGVNGGEAEALTAALDAGAVCLQTLTTACLPDLDLADTGGLDVLPRSAVMRQTMDVLRKGVQQSGIEFHARRMRPVLIAAMVDATLAAMLKAGPIASAYVVCGECGAFQIEMEGVLDVPAEARGALWLEMVHGLRPGVVRGGIVSAGARFGNAPSSHADIVTLYGAQAAETALAAILVAEAAQMKGSAGGHSFPPVEEVWDALSSGVRLLSTLRDQRLLRSGVLTMRGRGRLVGTISADRLLRFGVSDWR